MLDMDSTAFANAFTRRPLAVRHRVVDHPLLTLDAIAELADRLPIKDVERHAAQQPLLKPSGAAELTGRPSETVRTIEANGRWMVLWYIEQAPEYKALLDDVLADVRWHLAQRQARWREADMSPRRQEAFLFLSAPNALTPVHFDPEQNFLLQISGTKQMNVLAFGRPEDANRELERYYDGGHRNLDELPRGGSDVFDMQPGDGTYVPSFAPHWVQNGPQFSISLSITFRTRASERFERVQQLNAKLRQLHLHPKPPGVSVPMDRAKGMTYFAVSESKRLAADAGQRVQQRRRVGADA
jgi:cupin superfamily protein